ncbi:uncharacterized protein [Coffea arabica]|uniref:Transposase Tnp1/En/Spm-like domain-containing protein n=1 Tax=Coffea arabica TaxID=13443 RepID=A0ABM4W2I9_COFAR
MARTKKRRNSSSSRLIDEPIDEHMENQSIRVEEQQNGHNLLNQSRITSTSSNHISTSSSSLRPLKEGDWISLFSLDEPTKVVAIGRLQSLDPSTIVGGQPLGSNWCEVLVQVVVERDEHLIRPYVPLQTIADSIGAPIAWPTKLVKICED